MSVPLMWWWGGEAEACGSWSWTLGKNDDGDDDEEDAGIRGGGVAMEV